MKAIGRMCMVLLLSTFVMLLFTLSFNGNVVVAEINTGVEIGQKATTFELLTTDDKKLELETFRKDKVILLVFSATWCPACRHEVPLLKEYYNEYKDKGLEVLNIDIGESEKKVGSFVEKNKINYPVVLDSIGKVATLYKVRGIPLNILLDKDGIIRYKANALPSKEVMEKLLTN